jgi:hypothetical protein
LADRGFSGTVQKVLRPGAYVSLEEAREWLQGVLAQRFSRLTPEELKAAERHAAETQTPEALARFRALVEAKAAAAAELDEAFDADASRRG